MTRSLKIALRRFQLRYFRRRPLWGTAFWVYLAVLAFSSVFGDRGLLTSYRLRTEAKRLDVEIWALDAEVSNLQCRVRDFRSDPRTVERYAREELHLVGKNEIQYIFR